MFWQHFPFVFCSCAILVNCFHCKSLDKINIKTSILNSNQCCQLRRRVKIDLVQQKIYMVSKQSIAEKYLWPENQAYLTCFVLPSVDHKCAFFSTVIRHFREFRTICEVSVSGQKKANKFLKRNYIQRSRGLKVHSPKNAPDYLINVIFRD